MRNALCPATPGFPIGNGMDDREAVQRTHAGDSRQQVMRLHDMRRREGIAGAVVSTPREISAGCGLSVRFELNDLSAVRRVVARAGSANLIGLYAYSPASAAGSRLRALSMRD